MTADELVPRIGKICRIRIRGDDEKSEIEYTAKIERIWADRGIVDLHIGFTYLHVKLDHIISITGGLQDVSTTNNPAQTITF